MVWINFLYDIQQERSDAKNGLSFGRRFFFFE